MNVSEFEGWELVPSGKVPTAVTLYCRRDATVEHERSVGRWEVTQCIAMDLGRSADRLEQTMGFVLIHCDAKMHRLSASNLGRLWSGHITAWHACACDRYLKPTSVFGCRPYNRTSGSALVTMTGVPPPTGMAVKVYCMHINEWRDMCALVQACMRRLIKFPCKCFPPHMQPAVALPKCAPRGACK